MSALDKLNTEYYDAGLWRSAHAEFFSLVGKTFKDIRGLESLSDKVLFEFTDGTIYLMTHWQNCCESVCLSDVDNQAARLIGQTIRSAEQSASEDADYEWTFYNIRTDDENLCIRWQGGLGSYYSIDVSFQELNYDNARRRELIP